MRTPTYSSIRLELTSHCNLACSYCHNSEYSNRDDDMTTAEIIKLIGNLKKEYPINKILLTGGEPLVKSGLLEIVQYINSIGIKVDMVTNGTLLTPEIIRELEEAGLKRIRISIDEIGETSLYRHNENPNELWKIGKMISEISNIEVCIHTVCSMANVKQLEAIYEKVLEIGARRWRVFDIGYQGGATENIEEVKLDTYYSDLIESTKRILMSYLSKNLKKTLDIEINNIFRTIMLDVSEKKITQTELNEMLKQREMLSPCDYVADHQLSIRSNGVATLCQYFHNSIYDFRKFCFDVRKAIQEEEYVVENQLLMKDLPYCSKCKYCLVCNSGCRSRAEFMTGDIKDADPCACYTVSRLHKEIISMLPINTQNAYNALINQKGKDPKYNYADLQRFLRGKGY